MHENDIFMHENDNSKYSTYENFDPGMSFISFHFIFMGYWTVHYFMYGVLILEMFSFSVTIF